jgi:AcrR family transcriptional regulator
MLRCLNVPENEIRPTNPVGRDRALGARDKIKHLRREQLLEATIETIASRGFSRTTLGHIAKKVGL